MDENPSIKDEIQREILKVLGFEAVESPPSEVSESPEAPDGLSKEALRATKKPQTMAAPGNGQRA
jgi:hypothetical protein